MWMLACLQLNTGIMVLIIKANGVGKSEHGLLLRCDYWTWQMPKEATRYNFE